ncbi:MAG: hypothetical protein NTV17_13705 [Burkholderiales bacterium]|nr:hypothetical protein [Burkholderiales bacterium]
MNLRQRYWMAGSLLVVVAMGVQRARAGEASPQIDSVNLTGQPAVRAEAVLPYGRPVLTHAADWLRLGNQLQREGRDDEAIQAYLQATRSDLGRSDAGHFEVGRHDAQSSEAHRSAWIRSEANRSGVSRSVPNRSEASRSEASRSEANFSAANRSEASFPVANRAQPPAPETGISDDDQRLARAKAWLNVALLYVAHASRAIDEVDALRAGLPGVTRTHPLTGQRHDAARQVGAQRHRAYRAAEDAFGMQVPTQPAQPAQSYPQEPPPTAQPFEPYTVDRWIALPRRASSKPSATSKGMTARSAVIEPLTESPLPAAPQVERLQGLPPGVGR